MRTTDDIRIVLSREEKVSAREEIFMALWLTLILLGVLALFGGVVLADKFQIQWFLVISVIGGIFWGVAYDMGRYFGKVVGLI